MVCCALFPEVKHTTYFTVSQFGIWIKRFLTALFIYISLNKKNISISILKTFVYYLKLL